MDAFLNCTESLVIAQRTKVKTRELVRVVPDGVERRSGRVASVYDS